MQNSAIARKFKKYQFATPRTQEARKRVMQKPFPLSVFVISFVILRLPSGLRRSGYAGENSLIKQRQRRRPRSGDGGFTGHSIVVSPLTLLVSSLGSQARASARIFATLHKNFQTPTRSTPLYAPVYFSSTFRLVQNRNSATLQ